MKSFTDILKYVLLTAIFVALFIPFVVKCYSDKDLFPLKGAVTLPPDIVFDLDEWMLGDYQQKKEAYLNAGFGLRSYFVRVNNQIVFSFFKKAKANGVVIGKDNYLYEEAYINAYYGYDYLGDDSISHTINRLKFISDTLDKLGKQLLIVFAPGKASFFPEYIPDSFMPKNEKTNYKTFSLKAKESGLNNIDFNKWFIQNKKTSKYPLFPKYGIHWSYYGTVLAADSILKRIGNLRHTPTPGIEITENVMTQPFDSDYDIADGMNLLLKNKSFDMAYPKFIFEKRNGDDKPKVLVIADSFYWGLYNLGISSCFQNDHFWYYNKQVYPESATKELLTDYLNIGSQLSQHDVIIIMVTEANLSKIGWGFIEKAESFYKGKTIAAPKNIAYYEKMKEVIQYIKSDKKWLQDASKRAIEKNISLDSNLILEAMWQLDHPNN